MKAMLASLLSVALLFSPALARADNASSTSSPMAELAPREVDVEGLSLSSGYGKFTGKLTVKAFVMINGVLKVKVDLKGWLLDANGLSIFVNVDDFLIAVVDLDASCALLKVTLGSVKVKVLGLEVIIRLEEVSLVIDGSKCPDKKFCHYVKQIQGKKNCFLVVKILNKLWGFHHHDDDCDDDCKSDD